MSVQENRKRRAIPLDRNRTSGKGLVSHNAIVQGAQGVKAIIEKIRHRAGSVLDLFTF